jgi:hypothetical protein
MVTLAHHGMIAMSIQVQVDAVALMMMMILMLQSSAVHVKMEEVLEIAMVATIMSMLKKN